MVAKALPRDLQAIFLVKKPWTECRWTRAMWLDARAPDGVTCDRRSAKLCQSSLYLLSRRVPIGTPGDRMITVP